MKSVRVATMTFALALIPLAAQSDHGWPQEVEANGRHFTIYQPQVDSWKNDRLEARAVVTVTFPGSSAPIYGIVSLSARTDVNKENRTVALADVKANSVTFPSAANQQSELLNAIRESLPNWPQTISLDRLLADLSITQNETAIESIALKSTPPKIIFSKTPAVLILIDGNPEFRSLSGTRYMRVINTPALLLFDSASSRFYLDGQTFWMTSASLNGPWAKAVDPPSDLDQARAQVNGTEEKDPHTHPPQVVAPGGAPAAVYVSTVPAELLQTTGEPRFSPIFGTKLSFVTNTESDIFLDVNSQSYFVLLSGRWFKAKSLDGPWDWVPGKQLPSDFAHIPLRSPKSGVLASVPGTMEAKEAVIANRIPQTAAIQRSEAKLDVRYDGAPQFRPIEGTPMEYAINTDVDVIHAEGRYYACHNAVWFVADSPYGPWTVADFIPAVIYTIPPSSPLFHDRYVYVNGATPEIVYLGYTPGYLGAFVWDDVVVFGTGWVYPPWYGDLWFGWPWTWGFGFQFGYWGGGWFWRPVHHPWWFHNPWYIHRVYSEHWNTHWNPGDREPFRYNTNVYNRLPASAIVRNTPRPAPAARPGRGDFYAGQDGHIYENRPSGWYRQDGSGQWQRTPANPSLDQQRQSRALGESRQREFQQRGFSPGVPMSRPPSGGSAPSRSGRR